MCAYPEAAVSRNGNNQPMHEAKVGSSLVGYPYHRPLPLLLFLFPGLEEMDKQEWKYRGENNGGVIIETY